MAHEQARDRRRVGRRHGRGDAHAARRCQLHGTAALDRPRGPHAARHGGDPAAVLSTELHRRAHPPRGRRCRHHAIGHIKPRGFCDAASADRVDLRTTRGGSRAARTLTDVEQQFGDDGLAITRQEIYGMPANRPTPPRTARAPLCDSLHGKREWRPVKHAAQGRSRARRDAASSSGVHAVSSRRRADLAADSNRRACHFVALPPRRCSATTLRIRVLWRRGVGARRVGLRSLVSARLSSRSTLEGHPWARSALHDQAPCDGPAAPSKEDPACLPALTGCSGGHGGPAVHDRVPRGGPRGPARPHRGHALSREGDRPGPGVAGYAAGHAGGARPLLGNRAVRLARHRGENQLLPQLPHRDRWAGHSLHAHPFQA